MAQRRLAAAGTPTRVPSRPRPGGFQQENGLFLQENGLFLAFSSSHLGHGGSWAVPKNAIKVFTADLTLRDDVSLHRS